MDHDHHSPEEHERRFQGGADRLRAPERLARLSVSRAVELSLENKAIQDVLDVGTGTGVFAEAFAQAGLAVTGLDVNPAMLAAARTHVPAEQLPFPDGSFDLVFMGLVLHETDSLATALHEARRVTRQRAAILEWRYQDEAFGPPLAHRLQPAAISAAAREAGFQTIDVQHLEFLELYRLAV